MSVPPTGSPDVVPAHPHVVAAGGVRWRDSLRTRMVLWSSVINAGPMNFVTEAPTFPAPKMPRAKR